MSDSIDAIATAGRSIEEKTLSLAKIKSGPDDLSIRADKIAIQQKQDSLAAARQNLADCSVRAPFAGIVVKVNAQKGDTVSSGAVLATLVTKQKVAEISLNEVDVAKVKAGQKTTLLFDAVDDLTISGKVAEVDTLGTVSQGVVNYSVKIVFDTQDDRIKPGMSVSAAIITEMKPDVLLAPNVAVKSNSEQYVVVLENNVPRNQTVEVGLSNDTMTEIISGLNEGDKVVTQTITATTKTKTTTTKSTGGIRIPGLGGGAPR